MSDLIELLRNYSGDPGEAYALIRSAADELTRLRSRPTSAEVQQAVNQIRDALTYLKHPSPVSPLGTEMAAWADLIESLARSEAAHKADAERLQQELDKLRPGGSGGTGAVWYLESWSGDGVGGPRSGRKVRCSLHGEFADVDYCPMCRVVMTDATRGK